MWSDPYYLKRDGGEDLAVLLVDTQGMFDHETTVGLTAAIFGLSTLLSSYQIYNVDKRIQEDNLQQLALFTEYGRMAFETEEKAAATKEAPGERDEGESGGAAAAVPQQPFQKIEFLVRDWQNFETEDEQDLDSMEREMAEYLEHVTAERSATDLKETREHINSCFEEISCFMMTHPGPCGTCVVFRKHTTFANVHFVAPFTRICRNQEQVRGGRFEDRAPFHGPAGQVLRACLQHRDERRRRTPSPTTEDG